tara:strand:- start:472450 stop:473508 length:1059 start_codon:yes stop_codon:yes gene_type:complete
VHTDFKLNGHTFKDKAELLAYAKINVYAIYNFLEQWFDTSTTISVNTSGSTGEPKLIQLKKEYMVNSALATASYFELAPNTTALLCLSSDYIAGKMMVVRALVLGWHLDVVPPITAPLKEVIKTYDFSAMVPMQAYYSIDKLSLVKKLIIGGGVVSHDLITKIKELPTKVYATYGMTETITHIAVKRLNKDAFQDATSKQSVYELLPKIKISKDARGCLVIQAPMVSDQTVITNDLVEVVSSTTFKWLGRYDTIINSGGIKLIPEQIEEKLSLKIKERFFVAGISDGILGEKLILVIESKKINDDLLNEVKQLTSLSKFEIPKETYFIEKFIETATKKIQRQETLDLILKKQ